jgi:hypothetical protein
MSTPLVVLVPHRLGRAEAVNRIRHGFDRARSGSIGLVTIDREEWTGDRLQFQLRALGQHAAGTIEVFDDHCRVEVTLPWLLEKIAERLVPAIRKQTTLLLEKK